MAQSYWSTTPAKQNSLDESLIPGLGTEKHYRVEDVQETYIEHKDRLVHALDGTSSILNQIRDFNKDEWVVRYPQFREKTDETGQEADPSSPVHRRLPRRSLSFADDPSTETEVVVSHGRPGLRRSLTLTPIIDTKEDEQSTLHDEREISEAPGLFPSSPSSEFNVLRLDLKLATHSSANSVSSLVTQLGKSSIANLLDERFAGCLAHIEKLRQRVEDTSSKVLVTGDLNAGKSTFVNALLRREVMPVDQQPCTTAFCEVHDAAENDGLEEVHIVNEGATYDIKDETTFTRASIADLEEIATEGEEGADGQLKLLKLYLADTRAPSESLLNNGVVDISLIDAPGLNRDSIQTTALFARQEEIDVVVFVVSAENHFTLSAKEFLQNASNEKAYLFIVVNKFNQIKKKDKCRRLVLEQIKEFSPRTYEEASDLVHFVDSAAALQPFTANPDFDDLESALRSFVLLKRSKSKLQPVSTYLDNVLGDVELLASANAIVAESEIAQVNEGLAQSKPVLEKMKAGKDVLDQGLESVEDEGVAAATGRTKEILNTALERVGHGQLGVENTDIALPTYPGILGIWDYARDVRKVLLASLDAAVKLAENEARVITSRGVDKIKDLAEVHLPVGVERSRRVFMPEAMFSMTRKNGKKSRRSSQFTRRPIVAGGVYGLGIGLSERPDLLETSVSDLFQVRFGFWIHDEDEEKVSKHGEELIFSGPFTILGGSLTALTMAGGKLIGFKTLIETLARVADLLESESFRKWALPIVGGAVIAGGVYIAMELPRSIPQNVGRRIRDQVLHLEHEIGANQESFVESHEQRIGKETRKVLRLAAWDLKERFKQGMEERGKEVHIAEDRLQKATKALARLADFAQQAAKLRIEAVVEDVA